MIKIKELNMIFNQNSNEPFYALKNINLEIGKNELLILKGISGSGKSTLLSLISALMKPTSGEIIIGGESIVKLPEHHSSKFRAQNIGFIFQSFNLFETLSVEENICLPLIPLGLNQKEIEQKVKEVMILANITHKANQTVKDLSGGEKQRCAIARALANDPKLILCDEPTANLDRQNSLKFIEVLKELKKLQKTIIISTHDPLFDTLDFIDKTILLKDGEIL